ncbi:CBS domain-containing protein [Actinophytocola gossypii]|uniref:CBS domain-containing protein n=1 Tax=Actinophytocola gossypii TaxID=2812003 RepID=A0ABT2JJQ2_9PSEU|nr:CBS domain-containing protein [Actinophytocola gossypii]MCT2587936.1 CBS domain-containing protein [Actinophytocola gossypii]
MRAAAVVSAGHPAVAELTVAEVMTRCPDSVPADAPLCAVAAVLATNRVSAVPVLDGCRPIGVLSEVDLVRAGPRARGDRASLTARQVMTAPVATIAADEPLSAAARRLAATGVRRLFVVEHGRLVGVLSRRDLLRGYLRDDDEIREQVERDGLATGHQVLVRADVRDGEVLLLGRAEYRSDLPGIERVVRAVPGVVAVRNRMSFWWNDEVERSPR